MFKTMFNISNIKLFYFTYLIVHKKYQQVFNIINRVLNMRINNFSL